jgi:hypothetical protein
MICVKKSGLLNYRIAIDFLRPKFVGSSSSSLGVSMLTPRGFLRIATPPYFFQPLQILKRLRLEYLWRSKNEAIVTLPWGLPIKIDPHEAVGYDIASQG